MQQGGLLVALGVLGAIGAWFARVAAVEDHESGQRVDAYANAILTDQGSPARVSVRGAFDNTPYLIAGAVCAVLVICGVILYASRRDTTV